MKTLALVAALTAVSGAQLAVPLQAQTGREQTTRLTATFNDLAGRAFVPGEEVVLSWKLKGAGVKYYESHLWAECELLFSVDDGQSWSRITPQLSVSRRDFRWVVPDAPTGAARIALQLGIEGGEDFHHWSSGSFTIADTGDAPAVRLAAPAAAALRAGSDLELEWSSTVSDLVRFEVLVSSDRGAHFLSVGETRENRFTYRIPKDYEGSMTIQIVAHREGLEPVRSALDAQSAFRVQAALGVTR